MTRLPHSKSRLIASSLFLVLAFFIALAPLRAVSVFDAIGTEVNQVFENAKTAVVRVRAEQGGFATVGSGFYIDNKGTILTASVILGDSEHITVEVNGASLPATLLTRDLRSGLAILRILNGTTPYLKMADSTLLKTAAPIIGLGYPFNLPAAPTFGMVNGFDTQYLDRYFATTHLRTSLAISPGQIGGPALNSQGELIGMIIMAADERKFTYVLPTQAIQKILSDIALHGTPEHGWVGVGVVQNTEKSGASHGVKISQLFENTPAANSGLQPGDVVMRIDQREIYRPSDVIDASFYARVGQQLPITISRNGKTMTFKFVVSERPVTMPVVAAHRIPAAPEPVPPQNQPQLVLPVNSQQP